MKPVRRPLKSLQARLLLPLLGLVTVIWLGAATMTWFEAREELDDLLDGHLAQAAALLVVQQARTDDDGVADAPSLHKYAPLVAFQVFHEGKLAMRSANAGLAPMSPKDHGFETVLLSDGERWRVFSTSGAERDVQVYVGEKTESRNEILWAILHSVLLPLLYALPLLALGGWWAVRQGLAPLRQLSHVIGQRRPQALKQVVLADLPTEMQPMVEALNALFERIELMVASERRFTADAAHELRTPIAGIRAQAQVAMGAGADEAQRLHALQATLVGCDRATRLVEQLLTLARLEAAPTAVTATAAPVDLSAVARRVAADLARTALARHQTLELDADAPHAIAGDDMLIGVLVRNLIDNAMRYSPDGARICVSVADESGQPTLRVEDSGPGMTESEMVRLGERFYRVLGHEQPGSGLGWSIVKRIANLFGAQVQVSHSDRLGGLAVAVRWPAPTTGKSTGH
ncbi:MAG: two-component sensor histidine kinase [Rhodoferax sp.]|uniref:ATP-binding protein n=1 Tax=Rhodoferax sp. TaxID=50421 RepID=UPI00185AFBD5|nr:ATP-binding protein [Rhodoferax sp.]NMM18497.1 two-component sensor histidine kinase [Rhodoferax sp.]